MPVDAAPRPVFPEKPIQFSLRSLLVVVTLVALLAGLCHAFPMLWISAAVFAGGCIFLLIEIVVIHLIEADHDAVQQIGKRGTRA